MRKPTTSSLATATTVSSIEFANRFVRTLMSTGGSVAIPSRSSATDANSSPRAARPQCAPAGSQTVPWLRLPHYETRAVARPGDKCLADRSGRGPAAATEPRQKPTTPGRSCFRPRLQRSHLVRWSARQGPPPVHSGPWSRPNPPIAETRRARRFLRGPHRVLTKSTGSRGTASAQALSERTIRLLFAARSPQPAGGQ
jgi:hypothetical protein